MNEKLFGLLKKHKLISIGILLLLSLISYLVGGFHYFMLIPMILLVSSTKDFSFIFLFVVPTLIIIILLELNIQDASRVNNDKYVREISKGTPFYLEHDCDDSLMVSKQFYVYKYEMVPYFRYGYFRNTSIDTLADTIEIPNATPKKQEDDVCLSHYNSMKDSLKAYSDSVENSWIHKKIKYNDLKAKYFHYKFNSMTKVFERISDDQMVSDYDMKAHFENKKAIWKHNIYADSIVLFSPNGDSVKVTKTALPRSVGAKIRDNKITQAKELYCKDKATLIKFSFQEYNMCLKHIKITKNKVDHFVYCGESTPSFYSTGEWKASFPRTCKDNANWAWNW